MTHNTKTHNPSTRHMVWRLLRRNISVGQIAGYAVANLVGLAIVLCAVRFYGDVNSTLQSDDSFMRKDYMVISRKVSGLQTMGLSAGETTLTPREVDNLRDQPWVRSVGAFTAANFNVSLSVDLGGRGMASYIFLESIPDGFLDIAPSNWQFNPDAPDAEVPIILSKDYLTLYNFGFASTRGLPQLSETLMARVPLTLRLSGNGHHDVLPARIVGFSNRLNTIAVPEDFMTWANERFGSGATPDPSRLIVEVTKPGDPAIDKYMRRHGYEVAGDKADNGRASYFLRVVTAVVIAIGAIISGLAFFILVLSIFLLLQKNRQKLHDLMLLGYSPTQVSRPYRLLVIYVNAAVTVLAIAIETGAAMWWQPRLADIGVAAASPIPALLTALAVMALVTAANLLLITRLVRRNF